LFYFRYFDYSKAILSDVTAHRVTMPKARSQKVLQKCSCAQETIE